MIINVRLGVAYYNQDFFNIKLRYDMYFGPNNSIIDVYLGSWNTIPIQARIDRTTQPNRTPRIMMGKIYTNWVQNSHQQGESLTVEILNPNHPNSLLII